MAAKDYEIALGMVSAYFAKKKKQPSNIMSADRREITEGEVLMLIDFYLNNYCMKNDTNGIRFDSLQRKGKRIEMRFVDIEQPNDTQKL